MKSFLVGMLFSSVSKICLFAKSRSGISMQLSNIAHIVSFRRILYSIGHTMVYVLTKLCTNLGSKLFSIRLSLNLYFIKISLPLLLLLLNK